MKPLEWSNMRYKYVLCCLTTVISIVAGAIGASLIIGHHAARERYESASVRFANHLHLFTLIESRPPQDSRQLLFNLMDGDVVDIMESDGWRRSAAAREMNRRMFVKYDGTRKLLEKEFGVPAYIPEEGRTEYLLNSQRIQRFVEHGARRQDSSSPNSR